MSIIWILLNILIVLVSLVAIKEIIPYVRYLMYYKKQGIPYKYNPILGILGFTIRLNDNDFVEGARNYLNKDMKDEKVVAMNLFHTTDVSFYINDVDLIKKFFVQEVEVSRRFVTIDFPMETGIFYDKGQRPLTIRGIFNQFFRPDSLKALTPSIHNIVVKHLDQLKQEMWGDQTSGFEYKEIDMEEFFSSFTREIVNEILFGSETFPQVEGRKLPDVIIDVLLTSADLTYDPKNMFTLGIMEKLNLDPRRVKCNRLSKKLHSEVKKVMELRKKKRVDGKYGIDFLDLMLKHNSEVPEEEKLTDREIIGNVIGLIVGSRDSTTNSLQSYLRLMSHRPEMVTKIYEEELPSMFKKEEDWQNFDSYDEGEYLNATINESMRVMPPLVYIAPRVLLKDIKLGEYSFKKGSHFYISLLNVCYKSELFEKPLEFNPDRFIGENKKKIKRGAFAPFSNGRRNCVGQNLGELIQKMLVSNFIKRFEMKGIDRHPRRVVTFFYSFDKCDIMLKPREN